MDRCGGGRCSSGLAVRACIVLWTVASFEAVYSIEEASVGLLSSLHSRLDDSLNRDGDTLLLRFFPWANITTSIEPRSSPM
jgi:hypothetical protein